MTWTRITADESTLPPIGVPVWLYDRYVLPIFFGCRQLSDDGSWKWVVGDPEIYEGKWILVGISDSDCDPLQWHPFPSVPEVGHG
jgi:hypothetical protein